MSPRWDSLNGRWRIVRRNPRKRGEFFTVLSVQEPDGAFRPLDQRVLLQLREMDTQRAHRGRQEKTFASLIEKDLQARQEKLDEAKAKHGAELMRQANDEFKVGMKRLERLGKV